MGVMPSNQNHALAYVSCLKCICLVGARTFVNVIVFAILKTTTRTTAHNFLLLLKYL